MLNTPPLRKAKAGKMSGFNSTRKGWHTPHSATQLPNLFFRLLVGTGPRKHLVEMVDLGDIATPTSLPFDTAKNPSILFSLAWTFPMSLRSSHAGTSQSLPSYRIVSTNMKIRWLNPNSGKDVCCFAGIVGTEFDCCGGKLESLCACPPRGNHSFNYRPRRHPSKNHRIRIKSTNLQRGV